MNAQGDGSPLCGTGRLLKRALTCDRQHVVLELNRHVPLWHSRKIGTRQVMISHLNEIHRGHPAARSWLRYTGRARVVEEGVKESIHLVLNRVQLGDGLPTDERHLLPPSRWIDIALRSYQ
jgi:hypothetical protein